MPSIPETTPPDIQNRIVVVYGSVLLDSPKRLIRVDTAPTERIRLHIVANSKSGRLNHIPRTDRTTDTTSQTTIYKTPYVTAIRFPLLLEQISQKLTAPEEIRLAVFADHIRLRVSDSDSENGYIHL